jgi:putative flippase GtrA
MSTTGPVAALKSLPRFIRFGFVGCFGFCVDSVTLYVAMYVLGMNPYVGRALSFLCAVTSTWYFNRLITFTDRRSHNRGREWLTFVVCNILGGAVNYSVYALYVHHGVTSSITPLIGVALGSLAGMTVNYTMSKHLVFRRAAA